MAIFNSYVKLPEGIENQPVEFEDMGYVCHGLMSFSPEVLLRNALSTEIPGSSGEPWIKMWPIVAVEKSHHFEV
jgi:hypothetical protein